MKEYYLYEVESDGKPIFEKDEWKQYENLTDLEKGSVVAYEQIDSKRVRPLFGSLDK